MANRAVRFALDIDQIDTKSHVITGFVLRESLFDGYHGLVDVVSAESFDCIAVLGRAACLRVIVDDEETTRYFHGVVRSATIDAPRPSQQIYRARIELGARMDLLKLGRNSRLFLDKSVEDVVSAVLSDAGIPGDAIDWATTTTYEKRENITQYNESDFAFIARLLYEEGIGFAIRNDDSQEIITFFDDDSVWVPIEGESTLVDRGANQLRENVVEELRDMRSATSDAVMLRDYDFQKPASDLSKKAAADGSTGREVYVHPGNFTEMSVGARHSKRILERIRMPRRSMRGACDDPFLEPGRTFTVQGHPRADVNVDHRVISVRHRGYLSGEEATTGVDLYRNEFVTIPADTPYRPPVAPPAPVIGGVQIAFATVPPGEEIHSDRWGRTKVRFPWDRSGITDDRSSNWLRVGQVAMPGPMVMPRKDFEVVVDYEMGDVDRPLVAGHLYNAEAMPPYDLPSGKTRTSIQTSTTGGGPGANEIRFEDSAGGEEIFMNASKDLTVSVENDSAGSVKVDETIKIGSNNTISVGGNHQASVGANRGLTVSGSQKINVGGDFALSVGGSATLTIGGTRKVKVGGDHLENTKTTLTRDVKALQSITGIAGYQRKIVGASTTKVGAAWLEAVGKSRAVSVKSFSETVCALKFIKAKSMSISCGAAYAMNAAAEKVTCGGSRTDGAGGAVTMSAGGGITVSASNVVITGENKIIVLAGGCVIKLSKGGQVTVKGATIDLRGSKDLSQLKHDSN